MTVAEQMKNTSGSASQQLLTSTKIKEGMNMANRSSNTAAVPEAKGALDKFKFEVASELGVPLSDGYNGNLTSKQNGSVGGYMVKKIVSEQPLNLKRSNAPFASGTAVWLEDFVFDISISSLVVVFF